MTDRTPKELFLLALCAIFIAGMTPVGIVRLINQQWAIAALDISVAGLTLGLFVYVYSTRNTRIPQLLMALIFVVGALFSSYYQGVNQIYWSFPAITAAFFLLESRYALTLCLLFFGANLVMLANSQSSVMLVSVSLALLTTIFVAYSFAMSVKHQHAQLYKLASIDPLTGVNNRRAQDEKLAMVTAIFQRTRFDCSVLLLDVDYFKAINDEHGHGVGDQILVELASLIRNYTRATEILYRYGGEEFVIIAEHNSLGAAAQLAERLRGIIAHQVFTQGIRFTVSIGVAALQENEDSRQWLKRADDALFQAKKGGRNRVVLAPPAEGLRASVTPAYRH